MIRLPSIHSSIESGQLGGRIASSASSKTLAEINLNDLTFYFNTWLSRNFGDGEVTREVASKASLDLILRDQRQRRFTTTKRLVQRANGVPRLSNDEIHQLPSKLIAYFNWFI